MVVFDCDLDNPNDVQIIIRPLGTLPRGFEGMKKEGTKIYHVELYLLRCALDPPWPEGTAVVVHHPQADVVGMSDPYLAYLFVLDRSRGAGIAMRIVSACLDRWPNLNFDRCDDEYAAGECFIGRALGLKAKKLQQDWDGRERYGFCESPPDDDDELPGDEWKRGTP